MDKLKKENWNLEGLSVCCKIYALQKDLASKYFCSKCTCIHVYLLHLSACKCIWCKWVSFPPFF